MGLMPWAAGVAALMCGLVTGFLFAFWVVVMPGLRALGDRAFLQAFAAMDAAIQRNEPRFMLLWIGSVVAVLAAAGLAWFELRGVDRVAALIAAGAYLLGVQLPTGVVNVPLNNRLQRLDLDTLDDAAAGDARAAFEPRWVAWNRLRTVVALAVTAAWLVVLARACG